MEKFFRTALSTAMMSALVAGSAAAQSIDQQSTANAGGISYPAGWADQSFIPTASSILGGGVYLKSAGGATAGTLRVELWNSRPDQGGSLMASSSTAFTVAAGGGGWFDAFWGAVAVSPNTTYNLVFHTVNSSGPYYALFFAGDGTNPYANGEMAYNDDWYNESLPYNTYGGNWDITFREYGPTVEEEPPTTAPEPASLALLGTGLLAIAGIARRRRANAA